jgi:ABC-type multidrug transport system fused ATPase/permease subunit
MPSLHALNCVPFNFFLSSLEFEPLYGVRTVTSDTLSSFIARYCLATPCCSIDAQNGVSTELSDKGTTLSTGQRQLLCLGRALLKNTRMLLMDEATSNIDQASDALMQTVLRSLWSKCTVLTIAHRLQTIIDSDRILVIDSGAIVESGPPEELMRKADGKLRALVHESGATSSKV